MKSKKVEKKQTAFSKFEDALESPFFRRFMSVAYGLGASIVIVGALFKITHIKGANEALFIGMVTEAIIFALSALQKPHVEPDWSKVHPELSHDYHGDEDETETVKTSGGETNQLDAMLQKANINEEVIARLGSGLKNLSESTNKISDLSKTSVANDEFVDRLNGASKSVAGLAGSYDKTSAALAKELEVSGEFSSNVKDASKAAAQLKQVYTQTSDSLKQDIDASKILSNSIKSASESANKLSESYFKSSESILKNIEELKKSTDKNTNFNSQLNKLSENLSSLNTLYELQLKSSEQQSKSSALLNQTMSRFLADMEKSAKQTVNYQTEMDNLTKKMASLNGIYGNMLSAMNVK